MSKVITVSTISTKKVGFQKPGFFLLQMLISHEVLNQFLRLGVF